MSKPKLKDIFKGIKVGVDVGKIFAPGGVGKVLDVVSKGLDPSDASVSKDEAIKELARVNDEQTEAILALHERVRKLEGK